MFSTKAACKVYQHKLNKSLFIAIPFVHRKGVSTSSKIIESEGIFPDIQLFIQFSLKNIENI